MERRRCFCLFAHSNRFWICNTTSVNWSLCFVLSIAKKGFWHAQSANQRFTHCMRENERKQTKHWAHEIRPLTENRQMAGDPQILHKTDRALTEIRQAYNWHKLSIARKNAGTFWSNRCENLQTCLLIVCSSRLDKLRSTYQSHSKRPGYKIYRSANSFIRNSAANSIF